MIARLRSLAFAALVLLCGSTSLLGQSDPIQWSLKAKPAVIRGVGGERVTLLLEASISGGWHLYSINQGPGGPAPTRIVVPKGQEIEVASPIQEPVPQMTFDPNFGIMTQFFEEKASFRIPVKTIAQASGKEKEVRIDVVYQICNDRTCLPPKLVTAKTVLKVSGRSPQPVTTGIVAPVNPTNRPDAKSVVVSVESPSGAAAHSAITAPANAGSVQQSVTQQAKTPTQSLRSFSSEAKQHFDAGKAAQGKKNYELAAAEFRKAIEADPDYIAAHEAFMAATEAANAPKTSMMDVDFTERRRLMKQAEDTLREKLVGIYEGWTVKYPRSGAVQWVLGRLYRSEYNRARPYYEKAIELDPKLAKAYSALGTIAEQSGNDKLAIEYFRKAADCSPDDPYALWRYVGKFSEDRTAFPKLVNDFVSRFPKAELSARLLADLAGQATDLQERISLLEKMKQDYPESKYPGYGSEELFEAYLKADPRKAVAMAEKLTTDTDKDWQKKHWTPLAAFAGEIVQARSLMAQKNFAEVLKLLEKTSQPKRLDVLVLRAEALDATGKTQQAYDTLSAFFAESPSREAEKALQFYGAKLNKDAAQIGHDITNIRADKAAAVADFELERYDRGKVKLSELRGRAVLLNFWFPG